MCKWNLSGSKGARLYKIIIILSHNPAKNTVQYSTVFYTSVMPICTPCIYISNSAMMSLFHIENITYTVMRIIKLKIFPVPVRLHSGYGKMIFVIISPCLQYLRTLHIVWSLVRRRVTRRLTRLQTMHSVLKDIKTFENGCG